MKIVWAFTVTIGITCALALLIAAAFGVLRLLVVRRAPRTAPPRDGGFPKTPTEPYR